MELVIFDCDGVLVDSEPIATRMLLECIAENGVQLSTEYAYRNFCGTTLASIQQTLAREHGCRLEAGALARMQARLLDAFRADLLPMAGMEAALAALDTPFCVASSSAPERVDLALEVTGLRARFGDRIFTASMVTRGKPAPDLFLHAAQVLGVAPGRCVVVEDSAAGIEAGHRAGMAVFGFLGGGHARGRRHLPEAATRKLAAAFERMADLPNLLADYRRSAGGP